MSKVIADARSAVADLPKGATLLVGGFGLCGIPEELIEAVRDLGRKELTIVSNNAGTTQFGLVQLLRNNQVRKVMAITVAEVEELVPVGTLDPDAIHTPGIFVQRVVVCRDNPKRIERRTVRKG